MDGWSLMEQWLVILAGILLIDVVGVLYLCWFYRRKQGDTRYAEERKRVAALLDEAEEPDEEPDDFDAESDSDEPTDEELDELLARIQAEQGLGQEPEDLEDIDEAEEEEQEQEPPIIRLENVTMEFRVSTTQASGIKEFLIQRIKRQSTFRTLRALNRISFEIRRGEIVGIVGTNGSGKSTLLKLVSGALSPSSGRVLVDHSKVQLLTLGTGFDMELTARENIYLNGAIIGYSRAYIDEQFEKIIQFAELENFVDEKLKNYSSGMVSRLGFAIATSGKAAEILILDEILSVGDIAFRKKSMKRIQEMIHSGSTVIMVSHSIDTIKKQCTRAIWIEKGVLLADGTPKEVCARYLEEQEKKNEAVQA